MSLAPTQYQHIALGKDRVPIIAGTTMKVVELVLAKEAYSWSPEELHFQYPHLTLGQIYSALAYYWDHRDALDQDIEKRLQKVDRLQQEIPPAPLVKRFKEQGLI